MEFLKAQGVSARKAETAPSALVSSSPGTSATAWGWVRGVPLTRAQHECGLRARRAKVAELVKAGAWEKLEPGARELLLDAVEEAAWGTK